ncbi:hypothetical protein G6F57_000791 [Rhizopus arrhizus]|nr:hypothetical protein G6F24_005969 [Rhizopus arrhizus]KAG1422217.1 hypothetical protein G6F58_003400 [Rhizopus delemar]KAG0952288.1 hypothetical protein G6F30_000669 [Rhizopus arrhizus]KAG0980469.1 hypothetical protein G6F29_007803 [Rhizopus arrhizus]KAG0999477.1 hypothetical protein G6F28_000987 [Rhizopus arrhizus]
MLPVSNFARITKQNNKNEQTPLGYNLFIAYNGVRLAKHDASSVAFLHFSDHVMASVYYNTHDSRGLNIDGSVCTVKATSKNGIFTTYSQVNIGRFLPTSRPLMVIQLPESSSQPSEPRIPRPRWKRVFEEGLQLLEDECVTKRARLDELDSQVKKIMEERQSILVELEDVEKKKRLAKEIIF